MIMEGVNPIMLALFLGSLSLIPFLLIVCTAFLKIAMTLLITRNAIGVQQVPPNMALYGIALAATMFVMAPVAHDIQQRVHEHHQVQAGAKQPERQDPVVIEIDQPQPERRQSPQRADCVRQRQKRDLRGKD